jgi:hypothetical protein
VKRALGHSKLLPQILAKRDADRGAAEHLGGADPEAGIEQVDEVLDERGVLG